MRVLAFSDVALPEGSGGVERTLEEIYGRLAVRQQADVRLVALGDRGAGSRSACGRYPVYRAPRLPLDRATGAQLAISASVWRLGARLARGFRPHLIHAHTLFFYSSLVAAALARWSRTPLLLTVHVGALSALPQPYRSAAQLYERTAGRLLIRAARRVICVSGDVREHVLSLGADPSKVTVVPNGVDLRGFAPQSWPDSRADDGRPVLLCVGRLIVNKGQPDLLAAAATLKSEGRRFRIVLAGDGPLERQLERDVARRGLSDEVTFLGRRDDVAALMRQADVFVRPSLSEGMSLAVLEAMASGLPVVLTDVSGSRELIEPGVSGLLVRPGDVEGLTSALRRLLLDHELRRALGRDARRAAERYSWDHVADATAAEMSRVAA